MQVEIVMDNSCAEPKITIRTAYMTEEISRIAERLAENTLQVISGCKDGKIEVLEHADLIRLYSNSGKVFAVTDKGEYLLRLRLYELEDRLDTGKFVRISNSEIINLKKVSNFDLNFTGTICVKLQNGTVTYVSRRYVSKIKKLLGL